MEQITLSLMAHWFDHSAAFRRLLQEFQQLTGIEVILRQLDWQSGRRELVRYALDRSGADVSEIGTTWLSELAALGVIRPIEPEEQTNFGIPGDYSPISLHSSKLAGDDRIWAVPWMTETLLLTYRPDLFERARLNVSEAFESLNSLSWAADRLSDIGLAIPIALPDRKNRTVGLQFISSWLWQSGFDYVNFDGKHYSFNFTQTADAAVSFFNILRTCSPEGLRLLDKEGFYAAFHKGHAAAGIGGLWFNRVVSGYSLPEVSREISLARLPAKTFTGGSNLIIWKYSRHERAAIELLKYLTSERAVNELAFDTNYIPSRWNPARIAPPFQTKPYKIMAQAVEYGQTYPQLPVWGALEEQLCNAIGQIWGMALANPAVNLHQATHQTFSEYIPVIDSILARINPHR